MPAPRGTGFEGPGKRLADTSLPPWKTEARWKRIRTRHGRAIRFIESYCRSPKGKGHGQLIRLAPFQKSWLEEALGDGIDVSLLITPRGNGKSTFGGALAAWAAYDDDETGAPQVPITATTIGQAVRSCYGVALAMIRAEPELVRRSLIYTGISTPRVYVPYNGAEVFPLSNDPDGLQGLDYSLAIIDEIGFQPLVSWDSLRLASGKRDRSLAVGLGTPGLDRDNALYHLRKLVHEGAILPGLRFREYAAPDGCALDDRRAWRIANPAMGRFLRQSALVTDLAMTPEGHFRAFRLGQWVDGTDSWLGPSGRAVWDGLLDPLPLVHDRPAWLGIDVGIKRDSTAVVIVQGRDDGRFHATCRVWIPTAEEPVDVTDVMAYIRDMADRLPVRAVSFDPRFFDVPAKMLADEGLPMVEVPQSVELMTRAIGNLYERIKSGQISHNGDEVFATHILNAVPRFNERGFTLQKSKSRGRIDAAIALALALERALISKPEEEPLAAWA
jgi:phage terminase large subunit-like protein